jgi:predicted  nucleic acid-binding Zn ribbon protein
MLARIVVKSVTRPTEEQVDAFEEYLAALWWNGQINRDYVFSRFPVTAYVTVPRPDSLKPRFSSAQAKAALSRLNDLFGALPVWELLERPLLRRARTWRSSSSLYLFTHAFDVTSPVCAEDFDGGVPLYSLPITDAERRDLQRWAETYRDHDRVWLSSGKLELAAYRELAAPTSEISTAGRSLCRSIERATQKPTYYFLMRYYAHRAAEAKRPCPACGGRWHVARPSPTAPAFAQFEFRCRPCRLVSHCGVSIGGNRLARIGDFERRR